MINTIYVIAGPTATGKSNFSIELSKKIGGIIVNSDSMQVYKNLKNAHPDIQNIMQSFERQSVQELKDSEESLSKYYSREDNFKKILNFC